MAYRGDHLNYVWDSDDEEDIVEEEVRKFIYKTKRHLGQYLIPPYVTWQYERVKKANRIITSGTIKNGQVMDDQGYSVDMAIQLKKPVFLRNENGTWMTYTDDHFISCDQPKRQAGDLVVPPSHLGVGSDHPLWRKTQSQIVGRHYQSAEWEEFSKNYIDQNMKIKEEASGWPTWCTTEALKQKYLDDFYSKEGIQLNGQRIFRDPAWKPKFDRETLKPL